MWYGEGESVLDNLSETLAIIRLICAAVSDFALVMKG